GLRGGPAAASAEQRLADAKVDSALLLYNRSAGGSAGPRSASPSIVDRFYYDAEQRQVPPGDLQANPFLFKAPPKTPASDVMQEAQSKAPAAAPSGEWKGALSAAQGLKLQSVLSGSHGNVAMISNNLLTEGQTIRGWTVNRIDPKAVTLSWKNRKFILRMPDSPPPR
ncbi:MAG TPA: hypothetical protein VMZ50_14450, partial [Phycisphaerae bacterium]|nr:hypothetical protein [Phycisphaerae bacterium]